MGVVIVGGCTCGSLFGTAWTDAMTDLQDALDALNGGWRAALMNSDEGVLVWAAVRQGDVVQRQSTRALVEEVTRRMAEA